MLSRIPYFLLMVICVIFVAGTLATGGDQLKSANAVKDLLACVQRGDINSARLMLGDNTCSCPPRGGWVSLLKYESGHEPNLAFLLRQNFAINNIHNETIHALHGYVFPWDKPEDRMVDLNILFLNHPPYFLPLNLAFGIPMSIQEFTQWRNTFKSDANPRVFSLRLRNSLYPGLIDQVPPDKREALLPTSVRAYIHPRDCAVVLDEHGKALSTDSLARQLPRLKAVHAYFVVVRRGVLNPWTIKSVRFMQPEWLQ
jgi:hypothetical protein